MIRLLGRKGRYVGKLEVNKRKVVVLAEWTVFTGRHRHFHCL